MLHTHIHVSLVQLKVMGPQLPHKPIDNVFDSLMSASILLLYRLNYLCTYPCYEIVFSLLASSMRGYPLTYVKGVSLTVSLS